MRQKLASRWIPKRTRVFAVGVLEYDDGVHWSLEGRRDTVLLDALRSRGVPQANITFIKGAQATCRRVERQLVRLLKGSARGDQLLLYYAGHGGREEHGGGRFRLRDGRLPTARLFEVIEAHFNGALAILTADCCYSGCLALEAPVRAGRLPYAALGSSLSTLPSTGNWTFTNCWIDALQGNVAVDLDGDGVLRLDELARHAERRLSFMDGQVCSFAVANGFPSTFELGPTRTRAHRREGELIEAKWTDDKFYKAEILGADGRGTLRVRWVQDATEGTVRTRDTRRWTPTALSPGTRVEVLWEDDWYDAKVLTSRHGMHFVRFEGYDAGWDEWVPPERIKRKRSARTCRPPRSPSTPHT